jgi:hypothetical protein
LPGVVLLDPGEERLGVARDDITEGGPLLGREGGAEQVDGGGEQELEGSVGQGAQHTTELAPIRDGGRDVEAVRRRRIGDARKAEQEDQGGMLQQVGA